MILIISDKTDASTNDVIDWIHFYYRNEFKKISFESDFEFEDIEIDNSNKISFFFKIDGKEIDFDNIKAYWYRRSDIGDKKVDLKEIADKKLRNDIDIHLHKEYCSLKFAIHYLLNSKHGLSSIFNSQLNKLICLLIAKNVGLDIPHTLVTTKKDKLQKLKLKYPGLITKAIQETVSYTIEREGNTEFYPVYTFEVDNNAIKKCPEEFFPSKFQENLDKDYELRIFYLNEKCYSMAIFSQLDEQTSVDFRQYNIKRPNRNVPYNLPDEIEEKIVKFMKSVNLNTGSIDMIFTKDEKYVFLEVNPIGQFGMVSFPCNYPIEKEIANYLINIDKNE